MDMRKYNVVVRPNGKDEWQRLVAAENVKSARQSLRKARGIYGNANVNLTDRDGLVLAVAEDGSVVPQKQAGGSAIRLSITGTAKARRKRSSAPAITTPDAHEDTESNRANQDESAGQQKATDEISVLPNAKPVQGVKTSADAHRETDSVGLEVCPADETAVGSYEIERLREDVVPTINDGPVQTIEEAAADYRMVDGTGIERLGEPAVQLANFTARITATVRIAGAVHYQISARVRDGAEQLITVPARQFEGLGWVRDLGAGAIISRGRGIRQQVVEAIQLLSGNVPTVDVHQQTGWAQIGGAWIYRHGGGAIDSKGLRLDVDVELPAGMTGYVLPAPLTGIDLCDGIRAMLNFVALASATVTYPLFAAIWRAALGSVHFHLYVLGATGRGKSRICGLIQQCFGAAMGVGHLPASWSSTGNALEAQVRTAKDAVLDVDDLRPRGLGADHTNAARIADRILRAVGNQDARRRATPLGTLQNDSGIPQALLLTTAETLVPVESAIARGLVIELAEPIDAGRWQTAHRQACQVVYAGVVAAYVRWISENYEGRIATVEEETAELCARLQNRWAHPRTADAVAGLTIGMRMFVEFAQHARAIDEGEAAQLLRNCDDAMSVVGDQQAGYFATADPVESFLGALRIALTTGRCHLCAPDGGPPANHASCGWTSNGSGIPRPNGDWIGVVDGSDLFIESDSALQVARRMNPSDLKGLGRRELHRRLAQKQLLKSTEKTGARGTETVRFRRDRYRFSAIHISADLVEAAGNGTEQKRRGQTQRRPSTRKYTRKPSCEYKRIQVEHKNDFGHARNLKQFREGKRLSLAHLTCPYAFVGGLLAQATTQEDERTRDILLKVAKDHGLLGNDDRMLTYQVLQLYRRKARHRKYGIYVLVSYIAMLSDLDADACSVGPERYSTPMLFCGHDAQSVVNYLYHEHICVCEYECSPLDEFARRDKVAHGVLPRLVDEPSLQEVRNAESRLRPLLIERAAQCDDAFGAVKVPTMASGPEKRRQYLQRQEEERAAGQDISKS